MARCWSRLRGLRSDEGGQVLPVVCVVMTAMLGMGAFAIDYGHAVYSSRELQATTDSAALAAARAMPTAATISAVIGTPSGTTPPTGSGGVAATYSAAAGGYNARTTLPNVSLVATLHCLSTLESQGIPCIGNVPYNAVQVTQSLNLPTFFGRMLGISTIALKAESTAATRGGSPRPSNVAVVMDTTLSMNQPDTDCVVNGVTQTQMQCALNGFQVLLQNLSPCGNYQSTCENSSGVNPNPFDQVALFTFPNLTPSTSSIDIGCTLPVPTTFLSDPPLGYIVMPPALAWLGIPTATAYSLPAAGASSYTPDSSATYQVTGFLSDYRTSNKATTLNSTSSLAKAAGAVAGCGSMLPSNYDGVYGTYYAGAIYAAQSALTAAKAASPNSENVLILLSDGDATAPQMNGLTNVFASSANGSGTYPSWVGECGQAVVAAQAATAAGTLVYSVAYGSEPSGCGSDQNAGSYPNISPCDTMAGIASAPQMFYSDWKQSGSGSTCISSQPVTALSDIFASIANDLTEARLIPNNTQ